MPIASIVCRQEVSSSTNCPVHRFIGCTWPMCLTTIGGHRARPETSRKRTPFCPQIFTLRVRLISFGDIVFETLAVRDVDKAGRVAARQPKRRPRSESSEYLIHEDRRKDWWTLSAGPSLLLLRRTVWAFSRPQTTRPALLLRPLNRSS